MGWKEDALRDADAAVKQNIGIIDESADTGNPNYDPTKAREAAIGRKVVSSSFEKKMGRRTVKNYFPIELNVPVFFKNVRRYFDQEIYRLQRLYVDSITGIYNGTKFIAFPGSVFNNIISSTPDKMIGKIEARVEDVNKFYLLYVEEGTGEHMKPGWSAAKMDAVIGASRSIPRTGKRIVGRGKGSEWTDPAGVTHPGSDFLFIPQQKGVMPNNDKESRKGEDKSTFHVRTFSRGQKGKDELKRANKIFLQVVLHSLMPTVLQKAISDRSSFKAGGDTISVTKRQYERRMANK